MIVDLIEKYKLVILPYFFCKLFEKLFKLNIEYFPFNLMLKILTLKSSKILLKSIYSFILNKIKVYNYFVLIFS